MTFTPLHYIFELPEVGGALLGIRIPSTDVIPDAILSQNGASESRPRSVDKSIEYSVYS
jgi:hypothetical protein